MVVAATEKHLAATRTKRPLYKFKSSKTVLTEKKAGFLKHFSTIEAGWRKNEIQTGGKNFL